MEVGAPWSLLSRVSDARHNVESVRVTMLSMTLRITPVNEKHRDSPFSPSFKHYFALIVYNPAALSQSSRYVPPP